MATKKNPADVAVAYFNTAPLDAAVAVLAICKGIVARRQPTTTKKPRTRPAVAATAAGSVQ